MAALTGTCETGDRARGMPQRHTTLPVLPLVLLLATIGSVKADPSGRSASSDTVSLAQVLGVVMRQSPTMETARFNRDIAQAQVVASQGADDLRIRSNGSYFQQTDPSVAGNVIGNDKSSSLTSDASLSKRLSSGATIALNVSASRRATTLTFNNTDLVEYKSQISARVDQPLLRGRGEDLTRASERAALHNLSAAELDLRARARDEIHAVIDAYWELVWSHKDLDIRISSLRLAKERQRITQASVQLGNAPRTALLEVLQVLATREEEILLAQQRITERSLELRRLAGLEIGPRHLDLDTEESLTPALRHFDTQQILSRALARSPRLQALKKRAMSASIEITVAKDSGSARLDLNLSAGPLGTDDSLGGALGSVLGLRGYFVGGGLRYEQELSAHQARGRTQEARARRQILAVQRRDLQANIAISVTRAAQSAHIAQQRMTLSKRAITLSEKNIEAERLRFEAGRATNFDVLLRQEEHKEARLRLARAQVDYLRASTDIASLQSDLLRTYGIHL